MSKIIYRNNRPLIEINGEQLPPAAFRSFRPTPSNISLFSRCGVRFYQLIVSDIINALGVPYSLFGGVWVGEGKYDFANFDRQMQMFLKFAPNGYFCVMIQLDMPHWWTEKYQETPPSFTNLGQAIVSERWKTAAAEYLKAMITYAEEKYGDRIYAYSYSCGFATEWFSNDYAAGSPEKERLYGEYLGDKNVRIPTDAEFCSGKEAFRSPSSNEYNYLKFSAGLTPDLICFFAGEAQRILQHQKLIGLFFGYIDMIPKSQNRWCTNGYEKVWQCADIDMLFSPAAYQHNRDIDGVSSYQVAVDSIRLNKKMYLHEIDHRTELANYPLENKTFLYDCYDSHEEAVEVLRRELCNAIQKNSSLWWFDFFGGYYSSPEYEQEISRQLEIYNLMSDYPNESVAEIAVFVDPMSFLYLKENVNTHQAYVRYNIDALLRCGAPFEFYNMNDLPKLNKDKYKLFIFLNAIEISEEIKQYIQNNLKDKYLFFVGAPGYACQGKLSVDGISEITGMTTQEFNTDKIQSAVYGHITFGFPDIVTPLFRIDDCNARILASYSDESGIAAAQKNRTFYCTMGNIPYQMFTDAAECAGIHIYNHGGNGMAVTSSLVSMYSMKEDCEIKMPFDCVLYDLYERQSYKTEKCVLKYHAKSGQTKMFLISSC